MTYYASPSLIEQFCQKLVPIHCLFELTFHCNLKCVHCYICKKKDRELSTSEVLDVLDQLKDAGVLALTFTGGEALMRPDFFKIAAYARKLNFALRLYTNGTLINRAVADKIQLLKFSHVEISLYGFRETHESITTVAGSFEKTVHAVRLLKERKICVSVKSPVLRQNLSELLLLQEFAEKKLKAHWRGMGGGLFLSICDNGSRRPRRYRLDNAMLKKYMKELLEKNERLGEPRHWPKNIRKNDELCGGGFFVCNVTPYGELNPCIQIRLAGNSLRKAPFKKIWFSHKLFLKLRKLRVKDKKRCFSCELVPYCELCPGDALLEAGSLLAPLPEACRQARIRKEACLSLYQKHLAGDAN